MKKIFRGVSEESLLLETLCECKCKYVKNECDAIDSTHVGARRFLLSSVSLRFFREESLWPGCSAHPHGIMRPFAFRIFFKIHTRMLDPGKVNSVGRDRNTRGSIKFENEATGRLNWNESSKREKVFFILCLRVSIFPEDIETIFWPSDNYQLRGKVTIKKWRIFCRDNFFEESFAHDIFDF